ncbi:hypothetical protein [Neisseria meningitidis]|uniref:hypothetical protein n=1 Tax=Neisseria meningitidis TaxID=487 RepID=UPI0005DD5713|nr:hypothetical protein [Neisseria meningitidis]CKK91480.1 Uncharacterised protein [Neisseria meningitidis]
MTETERMDSRLRGNDGIDSRLRGNDGAGGCRLKFRHSRENGNLELLIFQTTFEHCRYPMN